VRRYGCLGFGLGATILAVLGLIALASTMGGSFILVMIYGIFKGGLEMRKYEPIEAEIVSIDHRCADDTVRFIKDMTEPCTPEEFEARRAAFYAPRPEPVRENNVVTYYPAKKSPGSGVAFVKLRYRDPAGVERTADVQTFPIDEEFYTWKAGGRAKIEMCKRDTAIIRTSVLEPTRC
jgi:hypothetical protein